MFQGSRFRGEGTKEGIVPIVALYPIPGNAVASISFPLP